MLVVLIMFFATTSAEGLFPSINQLFGTVMMPSLGEALGRYPDEEIVDADGSCTEVFQGISEVVFNTFSVYLSEKSAMLAEYVDNNFGGPVIRPSLWVNLESGIF